MASPTLMIRPVPKVWRMGPFDVILIYLRPGHLWTPPSIQKVVSIRDPMYFALHNAPPFCCFFFFNVVILFWPFFVWFPQFTSSAVVAITHSWPSSGCGPSCRPIGRSSSKTSSADCKHGPNKSIPCSPPTSHRAPRTALLQQKLVVETPLLQYTKGHPIRLSMHTTCIWFI